MKINIYTIYDTASGIHRFPQFVGSDGEALRSFGDAAINAESEIAAHPEDYTLYRLGTFNNVTGEIIAESPEMLRTALACVAASRQINNDVASASHEVPGSDDTIRDLKTYSPGGTA